MPPFAIKRVQQMSLQKLFQILFKRLRKDLEKHMRDRLKFNEMTPHDEAFYIHFMMP